jgi:hypothetical protein
MVPRVRHVRHVIWDWNGTLLDDAALGVRCLLVPSGHQSKERLRASGAQVLDTLPSLLTEL